MKRVLFTIDDLPRYRKTMLTPMKRIRGPFTVETKEGYLTCQDGFLAVDADGYPYPISVADQNAMYEPADRDGK